jgi:hypothetical protein
MNLFISNFNMRKFNQRTIIILLPFLLIVVGINYKFDPGNLFSNAFENSVSQAILSNKNVTNIYNYDERKLQKAIIAKIKILLRHIILNLNLKQKKMQKLIKRCLVQLKILPCCALTVIE